ncbi:diguanylate cyclase [Roseateles sp. DAIF2]|uniref:diguanylate cyclase domain-containing protein n=1 Tax=Roseateles sp. DAIF2 TaxID=2714952 RepID=UPI0018A26DA6|nr:diguanylate cyclase [Roseateles sp. DAIF2]QPF73055.1 diguanylate cyclase [Roseateles sp. DAIF2]
MSDENHNAFGLDGLLGRPPRLLVVDDQPLNIQALHQVFAADCQVLMATAGETALALAREQQPDLMLLDVQMPGIDGFEVCRRMKAEAQLAHIPVIFVTARQDTESETRALAGGAVDFLSKPFNPAVVRARVRTHLTLKLQSDLLRQLAFIDGLTGLYNRRHFDERFDAELQRARRAGSPLALLLADVDFFKRYNDHYGHLAGDDALRGVALAMRSALKRPGDLLARFGGEEFVVLLPDTDLEGAQRVALALQDAVGLLQIPHELGCDDGLLSISQGGVACLPGAQHSGTALLDAADRQLYVAKAQGRARAVIVPA